MFRLTAFVELVRQELRAPHAVSEFLPRTRELCVDDVLTDLGASFDRFSSAGRGERRRIVQEAAERVRANVEKGAPKVRWRTHELDASWIALETRTPGSAREHPRYCPRGKACLADLEISVAMLDDLGLARSTTTRVELDGLVLSDDEVSFLGPLRVIHTSVITASGEDASRERVHAIGIERDADRGALAAVLARFPQLVPDG